jgi:hypothetical protein
MSEAMQQQATSPFPRLLGCLRDAWDTTGGQSLRAALWSVHNDRVAVPLWTVLSDLDDLLRAELCDLMSLPLDARKWAAEGLLILSGEWDRIDEHPLRWE